MNDKRYIVYVHEGSQMMYRESFDDVWEMYKYIYEWETLGFETYFIDQEERKKGRELP